ncbi:hypothetical protein HF992_01215 [Streptococcus ovuberis]|uniref:Uncharacterized protein n=1 Tax=Streptococcus ovuberis TaxID=1936207 RepID=A0A7X6MXU9_9STRE|nr:hypothetical protein [Streptococcus ovuberis]
MGHVTVLGEDAEEFI